MGREEEILIADVDEEQKKTLFVKLTGQGYKVKLVSGACEAINYLQGQKVDVLILDVEMKDLKWYQALPIIKEMETKLPIIVTAANNTPELESRIRRHKVFYYHIKSFGVEELTLAIKNALGKQ